MNDKTSYIIFLWYYGKYHAYNATIFKNLKRAVNFNLAISKGNIDKLYNIFIVEKCNTYRF